MENTDATQYKIGDEWFTKQQIARSLQEPKQVVDGVELHGLCYRMYEYVIARIEGKMKLVKIYRDASNNDYVNVLDRKIIIERKLLM